MYEIIEDKKSNASKKCISLLQAKPKQKGYKNKNDLEEERAHIFQAKKGGH